MLGRRTSIDGRRFYRKVATAVESCARFYFGPQRLWCGEFWGDRRSKVDIYKDRIFQVQNNIPGGTNAAGCHRRQGRKTENDCDERDGKKHR